MRAGEVASREEFGFLWVEVPPLAAVSVATGMPGVFAAGAARRRRWRGRRAKATYVPRTTSPPPADPWQAPGLPDRAEADGSSPPVQAVPAVEVPAEKDRDDCESPEDADDGVPMNWRQGRAKVAAMRRKPPRG